MNFSEVVLHISNPRTIPGVLSLIFSNLMSFVVLMSLLAATTTMQYNLI